MTNEKAIKHLEVIKGDCFNVGDLCALDMAISALSNKGEWIPVSERLPEKNTKVYLACCDDGYISSIMYDSGRWLINDTNIIAWMPLPEPYKVEKGGE